MRCPSCAHQNRDAAKFCEECAAPLARSCGSCGAALRPSAKFCDECAAPIGAAEPHDRADDAVARKVVTIVFADLMGSTALHERLDPESVSRVMERYHRAVRAPVEAHGGSVVQLLGDGVMCAFGVPHVAEDDAIRAVRAAIGIQRAFREFAREESAVVGKVGLRVAVNTGEVVVSDDYAAGIGDPLNVAARLQQEAQDGDVLIGESTQRLVSELVTLAPLGVFALKGRSETVAAYRVVSLDRPAGASATPFVGREDELRRLMAVHDAAVAARRARLAVILGSPGLGKSRLIDEVGRRLGDRATVLTAHCDAAGSTTFAPIAGALRAHLGIDDAAGGDTVRAAIDARTPGSDAEHARIGDGIAELLAGRPASPEETFFVVRRFLAMLAAAGPVVLAIDDLQWAEPLLLDLVEHLIQWSTDVPLLLLAAARPELRETRSSLAAPGGLVTEVVTLAGLDAGAATRLAANVIGADELPAAVAGRVLATSEGNPLFVGELVRMLVHDGALRREGDRWTTGVELARLEMPPTIQALLAARIERLRPEERTVLERAAVVGRQFSRAAVTHLLPREITDLDARLEALRRSELIEPDTGWFLGEPALRFHHVLIRDAAYRRVLKGTRAELHGRFADWLESRVGTAVEHDETLGWHLEQAHQHLRELGPLDAPGRALGERAARYLAAAGRRALGRDDLPLAASLLGRAVDRLDAADPARADLALDWCEALLAAGEVGPAAGAIDELGRFTADSERLRAWHTCFAGERAALTDPQALRATAAAVAAAAEALASLGDAAGEAKAHFVEAMALARLGRVGACEGALDRALAAARRGNDRRRSNAVLANAPLAALWGPSPVARASGRCLDVVRVLRITQGAPAVEAVALRCQGVLEALRGRAEAARRMIASSRRMVEELGITHRLLEADVFAGLVELLEGDAAAAERWLRAAYDGLRAHGLGIDAARAAALLGRALLAEGRAAEAEALSHESEALAGDDLQAAIAWRGVRAEALARRGEHAAAVDLARAAVDLAAATDSLLYHADARLALAAALRAAGRGDEAAAEEARAIELWEAKGATLLAERARRGLGRVEQVDRAPDDRAAPVRPVHRRVRANAATANAARLEAAMAARDDDALPTLLADTLKVVDHRLGAEYGQEGLLSSFRSLLKAQDPTFQQEPVATLGDSLALCRTSLSASRGLDWIPDIGALQLDQLALIEVDPQGRRQRAELFAEDHLGGAVARLYERYAELLPYGPARARAAATARSVAAYAGPFDPDRLATALAPTVESVDHRTLGTFSARGAEAVLWQHRSWLDVGADIAVREDEILGLHSDALLARRTFSGTDRAGGGAFERQFIQLRIFGSDGLMTRIEHFDADRDAEALVRFGELTAEPAPAGIAAAPVSATEKRERRVRANAATAHAARLDAAIAARDADALPALLADGMTVVDHPTGAEHGREGLLFSIHSLLKAQDPTFHNEPLATLGDSLGLFHMSWSASGAGAVDWMPDIGPHQMEQIILSEVDPHGRGRRWEAFAVDRRGDAVARLYERYADLLPDSPARVRAAATARSAALLLGPPDIDRWATALAPALEFVDYRLLGFESARGAEAFVRVRRALFEVAEDIAFRVDDVLILRSDAVLVRWTTSGTDRVGGGTFERHYLVLWVFGADGLLTRIEWFDAEREDEALTHFDELTAEPPARAVKKLQSRVRPNAATAHAARLDAAVAARDGDALPTLFADEYEVVDHTTGVTYDRQGQLFSLRSLLSAREPALRIEPLATLGDSLGLFRTSLSVSGAGAVDWISDIGAHELEKILLSEVDSDGRCRRSEFFAEDRMGQAVARLYERYSELLPNGPVRARAAATARSIATPAPRNLDDLDRFATTLAPAIEVVDHRTMSLRSGSGADTVLRSLRALFELTETFATRVDDVLALRSDALLLHFMNFGKESAGGGAYERPFLLLRVFDVDGFVTRWEQFDAEREDEALTRFDELTAEPAARAAAPPARAVKKLQSRVRLNAATAHAARLNAAIAARDADALPALFSDGMKVVHHPTGVTFDRQGVLSTWRAFLKARDPRCLHEPLATLGDSLALCRMSLSGSGAASADGEAIEISDIGPYQVDQLILIEADAHGRRRESEVFAVDRMGHAVARFYERYADLLPDGPERAHAAATARSVAAVLDPDPYASLQRDAGSRHAPDVEFVDRRTVGVGIVRGAEAVLRAFRAIIELQENWTWTVDDILDLRSDTLLVRRTHSGTDRNGGAFERRLCMLWVFRADGLIARLEQFDAERDDQALARFDELTAEPAAARIAAPAPAPEKRERRVRPNAATAHAARLDAAFAARDADALPALFADGMKVVHHPTGTELGREGVLFSFRSLLKAQDPTFLNEPLATLGDSLGVFRQSWSASGAAPREDGAFGIPDLGPYQMDNLILIDADPCERRRWAEVFAADRLGDAVVRLYERYAELLPDGPVRTRAAATARSVAAFVGSFDPDRYDTVIAPDLEFANHRTLAIGPVRGGEALREWTHTLGEVADGVVFRVEDVLGLRSDALLVRWTTSGTDRASGGAFENQFLFLWVFGSDGLVTRIEWFDTDRDAEALARFDELTAEPAPARITLAPYRAADKRARRVQANAATASAARLDAAIAARDADALPTLLAELTEVVDHTTGVTYDRQGELASLHSLLRARDPSCRHEALATLGDSLALCRVRISASGFAGRMFDVGAYEKEEINLFEADANGRHRRSERFADHRLGDAVARLYERYAELLPDGPAHVRAAATARSVAVSLGPPDPDRYLTAQTPAVDFVDHRILGMGSGRGAGLLLRGNRALCELADDVTVRVDDVLALRTDALLVRQTTSGTLRAGGGAFEQLRLQLRVFGDDGLQTRIEWFDTDGDDEALARLDELAAEPPNPMRIPHNGAWRARAPFLAACVARDWPALRALASSDFRYEDRRKRALLAGDVEVWIKSVEFMTPLIDANRGERIGTVGDRIALERVSWTGEPDTGAFGLEFINLRAIDTDGRLAALINFDLDDRRAAFAEAHARFVAGEAASTGGQAPIAAFGRAFTCRDWESLRACLAVDVALRDHRALQIFGTLERDQWIESMRTLVDLAPDVDLESFRILAWNCHGRVDVNRVTGTMPHGGGPFENAILRVIVTDGARIQHFEFFDVGDADQALARFAELTAEPEARIAAGPTRAADKRERRVQANAATAYIARIDAVIAARDADALPALFTDESEVVDRPTGTTWDRQGMLASWRSLLRARDPASRHEPLGTLGDSLALCRVSMSAGGFAGRTFDVSEYEREEINLIEVDAHGRPRLIEVFAADRLGDAVANLYERYAELLPDGPARARAAATARSVAAMVGPLDLDRYAAAFAPAIEVVDHRILGTWSARGAEALREHFRSGLELADATATRDDEVLRLQADALLVRRIASGIARAIGGAFEMLFFILWVFGTDGLLTRAEYFDADRDDEALARFDELVLRPN